MNQRIKEGIILTILGAVFLVLPYFGANEMIMLGCIPFWLMGALPSFMLYFDEL